jgi:hypothetical protein
MYTIAEEVIAEESENVYHCGGVHSGGDRESYTSCQCPVVQSGGERECMPTVLDTILNIQYNYLCTSV